MKKKYILPKITTHNIDSTINLFMESQWKPGDGRPPWARPNHPKSESFDENNFNNTLFENKIDEN